MDPITEAQNFLRFEIKRKGQTSASLCETRSFIKDSSGHESTLARAVGEMRLAYRDPASWPSLMALNADAPLRGAITN